MSTLRVILIGVLLTTGCVTEPSSTVRDFAALSTFRDKVLDVPDTVRVGESVTITGYAWGSTTIECNQPDGVQVEVKKNVVRMTGYMIYSTRNAQCAWDYTVYPYTTQVTFDTPGTHTIRFIGKRLVKDSVQKTIVVK